LNKEDIISTLTKAGWRKTVSAPEEAIDFQREGDPKAGVKYNRIILFPEDVTTMTPSLLTYLMKTPPSERDIREIGVRTK